MTPFLRLVRLGVVRNAGWVQGHARKGTRTAGARIFVPKGQQDLAGGLSRRKSDRPRPAPNGAAEAIPGGAAPPFLSSLRDLPLLRTRVRRLEPPAKSCPPFGSKAPRQDEKIPRACVHALPGLSHGRAGLGLPGGPMRFMRRNSGAKSSSSVLGSALTPATRMSLYMS